MNRLMLTNSNFAHKELIDNPCDVVFEARPWRDSAKQAAHVIPMNEERAWMKTSALTRRRRSHFHVTSYYRGILRSVNHIKVTSYLFSPITRVLDLHICTIYFLLLESKLSDDLRDMHELYPNGMREFFARG